jgi:hypothetical protein
MLNPGTREWTIPLHVEVPGFFLGINVQCGTD